MMVFRDLNIHGKVILKAWRDFLNNTYVDKQSGQVLSSTTTASEDSFL